MRMPTTKNERVLMFALIGVVGIVILILIVMWGILPLLASSSTMDASMIEIGDKLKKARRELDYAPAIQREYDDAVRQMANIRSENILRPILGSYLVGVSEQIEAVARTARVRIDEIREVGVVNLPAMKKSSSLQDFKSFVVQVSTDGPYDALILFMQQMEDRNPFFCVSDIAIACQPDSPEMQRLTVRMEWLIEPRVEVKKGGGT